MLIRFLLSVVLLSTASVAFAVGPGNGSITKRDLHIGGCRASSVTVKWDLDSLLGEPKVFGTYKWYGDSTCKPHYSTTIWLKVTGLGGHGYVRISPVSQKSGGNWAYDTPGSPDWDEVLCGYSGTEKSQCFSPDKAKRLWKAGRVSDFVITWD